MSDNAEDMGMLKKSVAILEEDSKRHTKSNDKRKAENVKNELVTLAFEHVMKGVATGMEEIKDTLSEILGKVGHMEGRVTKLESVDDSRIKALEDKQFNFVKLLQGMVTPVGAAVTISICFTIITGIMVFFAPEHLGDFFETVKAAKK